MLQYVTMNLRKLSIDVLEFFVEFDVNPMHIHMEIQSHLL